MTYILVAIVAILAGIFFLLRFLRNVQPDDTALEQDLKELKASIAEFKGGFVPMEEGISASQIDHIIEKNNQRSGKGVFMSPSSNPVFAYAFRNYIGPTKNNLIYILALDHDYIFRTNSKGTEVTVDNQKIGLIRSNGMLYDIRNNEVAQIKRQGGAAENNTIILNNKEVAKIALPDSIAKIEAIEITGVDLNAEQKQTINTLAVFELINNMGELDS
jgi:hypothetical protein